MKKSPQKQKLEQMLHSSRIVAGGFMGTDTRSIDEIIDADLARLDRLGKTATEIAQKMQQITDAACRGLGEWVKIDDRRQAMVDEAKGIMVCPWPHPGRFCKRLTFVKNVDTGTQIRWSDLNIHLIGEHGFFEGVGSEFRIEPIGLVELIFDI